MIERPRRRAHTPPHLQKRAPIHCYEASAIARPAERRPSFGHAFQPAPGREAECVVQDAIDKVVVLAEALRVDGEAEALIECERLLNPVAR